MSASHPSPQNGKKTIVYDGLCVMCKGLTKTIDHSTQKTAFAQVDFTKQSLPKGVSAAAAERGIHVVGPDGTVYKNAAAILQILDAYPRWSWIARMGRLPLIRSLLELVYRWVAANRYLLWGPAKRLFWLKAITVIGLLAGMAWSLPLWLTPSAMLAAPVFAWWPSLPHPFDYGLLAAVSSLLILVLLVPRPRPYIWAALGIFVLLGLGSQMRWQPWAYQYVMLLAVLSWYSWRRDDKHGHEPVLNTARLLVASIYVWSGLHKINPGFVYDVYPWFVRPITDILPASLDTAVLAMGVFLPLFEVVIGVGLLVPRLRRLASMAAIGMHLSILALLGPWGLNWNSVVWPWNVVMALSVLVLFWQTPRVSAADIVWNRWTRKRAYHGVVLLLFAVLPVLSFSGRWDAYLSAALYSDDIPRATLQLDSATVARLPLKIPSEAVKSGVQGQVQVNVSQWVFSEYNVPSYPEPRVFRSIATALCMYADKPRDATLVIRFDHMSYRTPRSEVYQCSAWPNTGLQRQ